jgi:8-oxo-dGTP pyrophosphatase MutT (NUDIX family)
MTLPLYDFTTHPSISAFAVPSKTYLAIHTDGLTYKYIATGALVFDSSTPKRILLIQRASHDSMGSLWEVPGGGSDSDDPDILHSVARELWEEAGLLAARIGPKVGQDHIFSTRSGKTVCKFNFLVEAKRSEDGQLHVRLDPNEHQSFVWATEEEVKEHRAGDVEIKFTTSEQETVVFEAFKARVEMDIKESSS